MEVTQFFNLDRRGSQDGNGSLAVNSDVVTWERSLHDYYFVRWIHWS